MPDESYGLQIDIRCISCGNVPSSDAPLYEMQNHHYICALCIPKEEQRGRPLKGVDGADIIHVSPLHALSHLTFEQAQADASQSTQSGKDIFSVLEILLDATPEAARQAIKQKMTFWKRQPPSDERDRIQEQLREWHNELNVNTQFIETERQKRYPPTPVRPTKSTLLVHGHDVETIQDFVHACEQSAEGWQAGETYLMTGELEEWVIALTQNSALARDVAIAANNTSSYFRALNSILYRLVPERPFRLYTQDHWQPLDSIESIATLRQLAARCDRHWHLIIYHTYEGALLTWLEHTQARQGLQAWFASSIVPYANRGPAYRSQELELLLEQVMPTLQRPKITFTFDGTNGSYTLSNWDHEIAHKPVSVVLHNVTRGAAIATITLTTKSGDPDWITLVGTQSTLSYSINPEHTLDNGYSLLLYSRPGEQNPVTFTIALQNLQQMGYGQTYQGELHVALSHPGQQTPEVIYPLTLCTMAYRQGLRWHLWRWGLRGGWRGFIDNFLAGIAISLIFFLLTMAFIQTPANEGSDVLSTTFVASIMIMKFMTISFLGYKFFLATGVITGVLGSMVGLGKGHSDYPINKNQSTYIKAGIWLALIWFCGLLGLFWKYSSDTMYGQLSFSQVVSCMLTTLLTFLGICVLGLTRSLVERGLRRSYGSLLRPQGSEE